MSVYAGLLSGSSATIGGNVGIYTASPANKLQIGSVGSSGYGGNDLVIGNGTQVMAFYQYTNGPSAWFTNTNFSLMPSGVGSTGSVGIGTTSPAAPLHVAGTISNSPVGSGAMLGQANSYGILHLNGANGGHIDFSNDTGTDFVGRIINFNSDKSMYVYTNGSVAMVISGSGNVGIGTTNPLHRLQLSTAASIAIPPAYSQVPSSWTRDAGGIILAGSETSDGSSGWRYGSRIMTKDYGDGLGVSWDVLYNGTWTNDALFVGGRSGKLGYVGIGSTNPLTPLYVVGNIQTTTGVIASTFWTNTDIRKLNASTAMNFRDSAGNIEMIIDGSGRVGIGTTSPSYKLDVQGGSVRIGDASYNSNLLFGNSQGSWGSGIRTYDNSDAEMRIWHENSRGQIVIATGYNGNGATTLPTDGIFVVGDNSGTGPALKVGIGYTAANIRTGLAKLAVNGNVGIGIANPTSRLVVSRASLGSVPALGTETNNQLSILGDSSAYGMIVGVLTNGNVYQQVGRVDGTATAYNLLLQPAGGNVNANGIILGDDSTYGAPYKVVGFNSVNNGGNRIFAASTNADGMFFAAATGRGFAFRANGGTTDHVIINSSGNVGIGTTSPTSRLSIQNSGGSDSVISNYVMTNGSNAATFRTTDSPVTFGIHSQNGGNIYIKDTSDNVLFYGKDGGNVGIGTTTPSFRLDVSDNTVRTGRIYRSFQSYTGTTNNLVRTWDGVLVAGSDSSGADVYTIIDTGVPQDSYMMGGFTIDWFENYSSTNAKTQIKLSGYWNPESNGGFIGWEYTSTNPTIQPTIQVARNSSTGNTAFILSHFNSSYAIIVARDLWLGYNSGADTYGTGWTIQQVASTTGYTNFDTVASRTAQNTLTISSPLSGTSYNGSAAVTIALASGYGDTQNPYASKTGNTFLAAPNGSTGAPSFRAIVAADIPTLNQNTTGTASNITAYTINQNLGTGNSPSFVTITSTQATGTAPLTVASTTVVTNLNADLLDGQHGSYYNSANNLSGTIPSAVLGNSTVYVGTTGIALNRASAAQTLTGVSIDGNAAGITGYSGTYWTSNNDGVSSGLDADLLDGQHGSYYTTAGNLSGTIPSAVLGNSTVYVGTTAIALNRGSAGQTLTGVSIDGNAATVSTVAALGTGNNYNTDRTVKVTNGVAVYSGYSSGTNRPTTYDVAAQFIVNGAFGFEIAADWIGTADTPLYVRSLRDCCQNWSSWSRILTDDYNPASSLSGTIPSAVLGNSTVYIGTTAIALNRGSAGQTLTGVSIDGNAATVSNLTAVQFFNNMGEAHSARTSFDASTPTYNFGFRYVQGSTNGPGTSGTQFYSWYIGLGNDYPATGAGSYGAMFAVDRNVSNPYLSVRYNEGNSFGTWRKIYAGYADTAGTAVNITAYTINQNLGTGNSPTFAGLTVDTNTLYVDATNDRVGIGTTSPSSKLHVYTGTTSNIAILEGSAGQYLQAGTDAGGFYLEQIGTTSGNRILRIQNSNGSGTYTQLFFDGANQRIYTNAATNVGIGTTSPSGKLSISGGTETFSTAKVIGMTGTGASNDNQYNWAITSENDVNWGFRVSNKTSGQYYTDILGSFGDGNNRAFRVINKSGATETVFMFINSSGNVGVGTTTPAAKIDVYSATDLGSGANGIRVHRPASYGQYGYLEYLISSDQTVLGSVYTGGGAAAFGKFYFRQHSSTTSRDAMIINSDGFVGMGTTSPGRKLDVVGRLRFRSDGSVSSGVWHADSSGNEDIFVGQQGTAYTDSWGVYSNGSWRLVVARADGEIYLNGKAAFATADTYLRINQSNAFSNGIWFGSSNIAQGSTVYTSFGSNGGTTSSRIYIYGGTYNGTNVINLDGSTGNAYFAGNIGIGVSPTSNRLDIHGGHTTTTARLYSNGDGASLNASLDMWASEPGVTYDGSGIGNNVNGHPYYGRRNTGLGQSYIRFYAGQIFFDTSTGNAIGNTRLFIGSGGNVGIATTSPSYPLDVSGIIRTTNIYINGLTYTWPTGHGSANAVLTNNGSGTLSWSAAAVASSTSLPSASIAPTYSNPYGITANDVGKRLIATGSGGCLIIPASSSITVGSQVQITTLNAPLVLNRTLSQSIDSSFAPQVLNSRVDSIAVKPSGKILIGGGFLSVGSPAHNYFIQLNNDGTIDNSSGPASQTQGATQVTNSTVYVIKFDADRNYLIGGNFTSVFGVTRNYIARLTPEDTLDRTFDPNVNGSIKAIVVLPNRKILIGGSFSTVGGVTRHGLARLNSDGTLDTSFNASLNVNAYVYGIAIQSDEKIVICGSITTVGGQSRLNIARINSDGTLDTGFDTGVNYGPNGAVYNINIQSDGKIVFSGTFTQVGVTTRNNIARFNSDATLDTGYNPNVNNVVYAMDMEQDGRVVIGGTFDTVGGSLRRCFARLNTDGTLDALSTNYQSQFYYVFSLLAYAGKVLVGGEAAIPGRIMRLVNYVTASNTTDSIQSPIETPAVLPQYASITLEKITSTTWNIVSSNL